MNKFKTVHFIVLVFVFNILLLLLFLYTNTTKYYYSAFITMFPALFFIYRTLKDHFYNKLKNKPITAAIIMITLLVPGVIIANIIEKEALKEFTVISIPFEEKKFLIPGSNHIVVTYEMNGERFTVNTKVTNEFISHARDSVLVKVSIKKPWIFDLLEY